MYNWIQLYNYYYQISYRTETESGIKKENIINLFEGNYKKWNNKILFLKRGISFIRGDLK